MDWANPSMIDWKEPRKRLDAKNQPYKVKTLKITTDPRVHSKFESYPDEVKPKLEYLRKLIIETATEIGSITELEETLKWGEPSYLVKNGSTIRMDWKAKAPEQFALYFKCTSKLVSTFKKVYGDKFRYEKNRAIIFDMTDEVPVQELKDCIGMALQYHILKNEPLLGKAI